MIHLVQVQLDYIRDHAVYECPMEACGILLADATAMRCENVARDRWAHAAIGRIELERVARHNQVIGFYHSHVDRPPIPSPADFAGAHHFGFWYVIASVSTYNGGHVDAITTYILRGTEEKKIFEHTILRDGKTLVAQTITQSA